MIELMDYLDQGPAELARKTDKPLDRWKNIRSGRVRASTEELEDIARLWPEFSLWLTTGTTIAEAGQISPELDQVREKLQKAG